MQQLSAEGLSADMPKCHTQEVPRSKVSFQMSCVSAQRRGVKGWSDLRLNELLAYSTLVGRGLCFVCISALHHQSAAVWIESHTA